MEMNILKVNSCIELEKINLSHAFLMFEAVEENRNFLSEWLSLPSEVETQDGAVEFIRAVLKDSEEKEDSVFVIWYRKQFSGLISLKENDLLNKKIEIGYWLTENMTGKGIVTKSVKVLSEYIFMVMNLNRIVIRCAVGNIKSSAIPKRLGFTFEGVEREGEKHPKNYLDMEVYSFLRKDNHSGLK